MWIAKGSKENLINLLQDNLEYNYIQISSPQDIKKYLTKFDIVFIWSKSPLYKSIPIPDVIICLDNELKMDLLAWVTTYVNELRPFTSFCRVLDKNEFSNYIHINKDLAKFRNLNNICLGLIICEALSTSNNYPKQTLTPLHAKSTYSYIFSQIVLSGNYLDCFPIILELANRLNKSLPNFKKNFLKDDLLTIWNIVTELIQNNNLYFENHFNKKREYIKFIIESSYEILEYGKITPKTLRNITYKSLNIEYMFEEIGINTREIRVSVFEKIIQILETDKSIDKNLISFIAAYLATQVSPGSLKYINLLQPYTFNYPSIFLWYGFLTGLYKNSEINNYSEGFGWRIQKDLFLKNELLQSPECDISIDELEIIRRSNPTYIKNIRTENNSYIRIEVAPDIVLPLELLTEEKNQSDNSNQNIDIEFMNLLRSKIKELYSLTSNLENSFSKTKSKKAKK